MLPSTPSRLPSPSVQDEPFQEEAGGMGDGVRNPHASIRAAESFGVSSCPSPLAILLVLACGSSSRSLLHHAQRQLGRLGLHLPFLISRICVSTYLVALSLQEDFLDSFCSLFLVSYVVLGVRYFECFLCANELLVVDSAAKKKGWILISLGSLLRFWFQCCHWRSLVLVNYLGCHFHENFESWIQRAVLLGLDFHAVFEDSLYVSVEKGLESWF